MDSFARDRGWPVRIVRCKEAEEGRPPEDRTFPVFAVVATKFKRMENAIPVRNINRCCGPNMYLCVGIISVAFQLYGN